jgi:hypothetical protein
MKLSQMPFWERLGAQSRTAFSISRSSSSLLDCLGRVRRVKAKPHAVASRALNGGHGPRDGSYRGVRGGQGTGISAGRTTVRHAISVPLTSVTSGLSRSLVDTLHRRSGQRQARTAQLPKLTV